MKAIDTLIKELVKKHGCDRQSLLPILQGVVAQENYLSEFAIIEIARQLNISATEVYGTATFYSFLEYKKMGKYVIRICKTITCSMKGEKLILQAIEDMLKIKIGETTSDGKFSLMQTNCLGLCHKAPAMIINSEPYTDLTPESVREILINYINKIDGGAKDVN